MWVPVRVPEMVVDMDLLWKRSSGRRRRHGHKRNNNHTDDPPVGHSRPEQECPTLLASFILLLIGLVVQLKRTALSTSRSREGVSWIAHADTDPRPRRPPPRPPPPPHPTDPTHDGHTAKKLADSHHVSFQCPIPKKRSTMPNAHHTTVSIVGMYSCHEKCSDTVGWIQKHMTLIPKTVPNGWMLPGQDII
jgi:hypothetical protein